MTRTTKSRTWPGKKRATIAAELGQADTRCGWASIPAKLVYDKERQTADAVGGGGAENDKTRRNTTKRRMLARAVKGSQSRLWEKVKDGSEYKNRETDHKAHRQTSNRPFSRPGGAATRIAQLVKVNLSSSSLARYLANDVSELTVDTSQFLMSSRSSGHKKR